MQYRRLFIDAGGERFNYIPCLNDGREHVEFLTGLITEQAIIAKDEDAGEPPESVRKNGNQAGAVPRSDRSPACRLTADLAWMD